MIMFFAVFAATVVIFFGLPYIISKNSKNNRDRAAEYHNHCTYKIHREQTANNTVRMTFEKWLALYNADPIHWYSKLGRESWVEYQGLWYDNPNTPEGLTFITFATQKDYFQWKEYVESMVAKGQDAANIEKTLSLAKEISGVAQKRSEEAREEARKAMENYQANLKSVLESQQKSEIELKTATR